MKLNSNSYKSYHAYTMLDGEEVVFIGYDKLVNIISLTVPAAHPDFKQGHDYTVQIHQPAYVNSIDAANHASSLITGETPPLNRGSYARFNRVIVCEQTGQSFETQEEAARVCNISQPQLSKHLRRLPGHKSVKGLSFIYKAAEQSQPIEEDLSALSGEEKAWWHTLRKIPVEVRTEEQTNYLNYLQCLTNTK